MIKRRVKYTPHNSGKKRITFTFEAPEAQSVIITGTFCNWQTNQYPLKKARNGLWKRNLFLTPGRYEYRLMIDGEWGDDPSCIERIPNQFGTENCVLNV